MSRLNITPVRIEMVRSFYNDGKTAQEVAEGYGLSKHTVYALGSDPKMRRLARQQQQRLTAKPRMR